MSQYGFYFDMNACIGCHTCQVACNDKNNLPTGTVFRNVKTFETGAFPEARWYHYSGSCNHCENPKCVEGCPTGAMHKAEDGTVQHDGDLCIACQYCTWNCPYGVPQYMEETKKIGKCDSCKDLRDQGGNPACVDACLMRCLHFGKIEDLEKQFGKGRQDLPILVSSSKTNPNVRIQAKPCALSKDFTEKGV